MNTPVTEYPDVVGSKPEGTHIPFRPYIAPETIMRELTPRAVITGTILGMIFGASSLYLVLKVGLTVSASIPVAVISIAFFRLLSTVGIKNATILENNIVQTAGSAGESIAFGVGVTMPAVIVLGFDLELSRVMIVSILGGLLGILMMIPLRRALIVQQHGILKYPEGTACAEVLKAGASEESRALSTEAASVKSSEANIGAKVIFTGFGIGLLYKVANVALKGWKEVPEKIFGAPFKSGSVAAEISPELLGVGYIIGPRIAAITCAGGVLSYLVLIPAIKFFGENLTGPLSPSTTLLIRDMSPNQIRSEYILYIGAGAVTAGGIISLIKSMPTIWHGLKSGLQDIRRSQTAVVTAPRTDQDLSMKFVLGGVIFLIIAILAFRQLQMNHVGALLIVAFGFLFVTVSSRLTGEIGSSSNPISGMTIATLLFTCLIFLIIGWDEPFYFVTALSVGAIVCIASSNGGTTSQDLKSGFLVGATPKYQQIAILIGAFASALVLGPILTGLNDSGTVYVKLKPEEIVSLAPDQTKLGPPESIPQEHKLNDTNQYRVWYRTEETGGRGAGKYLVDNQGIPVYYVDPGINGKVKERVYADGTSVSVQKYDAPKVVLMSYIIKGVLKRELPWGLVLLGVMIAVVLELCAIPSLAFAVGVYLPLSTTSTMLVGGIIRWLIDRNIRRRHHGKNMTEEELVAEGDKSPGVLMASGYIAGGAIAGIVIAFMAAALADTNEHIESWAKLNNPFYSGSYANILALLPFAVLVILLYAAGREWILSGRRSSET
jgi:putative OPT family oligopeptide transporter